MDLPAPPGNASHAQWYFTGETRCFLRWDFSRWPDLHTTVRGKIAPGEQWPPNGITAPILKVFNVVGIKLLLQKLFYGNPKNCTCNVTCGNKESKLMLWDLINKLCHTFIRNCSIVTSQNTTALLGKYLFPPTSEFLNSPEEGKTFLHHF